jgi:hypothetical protein
MMNSQDALVVPVPAGGPVSQGREERSQACWRFLHEGCGPLADACSYTTRQRIKQRLQDWPHLSASLRTGARSVTITARDCQATAWLVEHIGRLMSAVAAEAGRALAVDVRTSEVSFRKSSPVIYTIPKLVLERSSGASARRWGQWQDVELADPQKDALHSVVEHGLLQELHRWGRASALSSLQGLRILDYGKPMPIVPAEGPRGMARLGVKFVAPWMIDGELFVGHHTLLGYGLVIKSAVLPAAAVDVVGEGGGRAADAGREGAP